MKEYRRVTEIYYKNKCYEMYLDSKNKRFFLKKDNNGNLSYITIEELIDISSHLMNIPLVMNAEKTKKVKLVPKIIIGGVSVTLSFAILSTILSMQQEKNIVSFEDNYNSNYSTGQTIEEYVSVCDSLEEQKDEDLVVDTYQQSENFNYIYIYDMDYADLAFGDTKITVNDLKTMISNNSKISSKYKNLLFDYCDQIEKKYPNIELRAFYENLKSLEVVECTKDEFIKASLSVDSYGCYVKSENKIYVLKDYNFEKGTWPYQVIFHEFSHCLRTGIWTINNKEVRINPEGQNFKNMITSEALNSLFAVSLFDYEENDIAYQLQSNYHKIMIENMNNYSIDDYVNHSLSYYAKKLDEFNNDKNYATVILELIQLQYDDFHSSSIKINQEEFYPLYDYVAKMYYTNNISSDMNYSEAKQVTDDLLNKILFDVPEEYNIDISHFYDYLDEYCESIGITVSTKSR